MVPTLVKSTTRIGSYVFNVPKAEISGRNAREPVCRALLHTQKSALTHERETIATAFLLEALWQNTGSLKEQRNGKRL